MIVFRIQQVDGGFFERFGSLLREQSHRAIEEEEQEKIKVAEAASQVIPRLTEEENEEDKEEGVSGEDDSEETSTASDSELDQSESSEYCAVGWNVSTMMILIVSPGGF